MRQHLALARTKMGTLAPVVIIAPQLVIKMSYSKSDLSRHNLNTYAALLTPACPTVEIPVRFNKSKTATLYVVNKGYKLDLWLVTPSGVTTCPDESDLTKALKLKIRALFASIDTDSKISG